MFENYNSIQEWCIHTSDRKGKEDNMFYISTPNKPSDRGRYERTPESPPSTYDPAGWLQNTHITMRKREIE